MRLYSGDAARGNARRRRPDRTLLELGSMSDRSSETREFERLAAIVRELRQRCPWDREQTAASLSKYLVEEAYEALDAIERVQPHESAEELGDLLAQILFQAVIAEEGKHFRLDELMKAAADKLVRRHPHVYGGVEANSSGEVLANWEKIKHDERQNKGAGSALDGIPRAQPALMRAEKLGHRARSAGMDWADARGVLAKVREELNEVEHALDRGDSDAAAAEVGDMMLALANVPRFLGHDAEQTLRRACDKFVARFEEVERIAAARQLDLKSLDAAVLESLWQEAKRRLGSS
jgi:MazG family protein